MLTALEHGKLVGQLKDLRDYWEPNDAAAADVLTAAIVAIQEPAEGWQPTEAMVERVENALIDAFRASCIRTDGTCYAYVNRRCAHDSACGEVDGEFCIRTLAEAAIAATLSEGEGQHG